MSDSGLMENVDYQLDWADFVGQKAAVRQIEVAAKSAKMRRATLPHTLLEGSSGAGKTTLAVLAAREMGVDVKVVSGKVKASEARLLLSSMETGDILLWDEAHNMVSGGKSASEWLLNYLQDGVLITAAGEEEMPRVSIIACTNESGKLPDTILSRFQLRPILEDYTEEEAAQIAEKMAAKIFGQLTPPNEEVCAAVAIAGNCNPRTIKMLLSNLFDMAIVNSEVPEDGAYDLAETLGLVGITADGLDKTARDYLVTLLRFPEGLGMTAMNEIMAAPGGLGPTERALLKKGMILKLKSGRLLSGPGIKRAQALRKEMIQVAGYAAVA